MNKKYIEYLASVEGKTLEEVPELYEAFKVWHEFAVTDNEDRSDFRPKVKNLTKEARTMLYYQCASARDRMIKDNVLKDGHLIDSMNILVDMCLDFGVLR